jgi:hypothetical protein
VLVVWRLYPSQLAWTDGMTPPDDATIALATHVVNAAIVLVLALSAVYVRYRSSPDVRIGLIRVGLGLVAGGIAAITPAVAYATAVGFENDRVHVITEVAIAVFCCTVGLAIGAHSWLHRRPLVRPDAATAS